jgi:hypothetical protein
LGGIGDSGTVGKITWNKCIFAEGLSESIHTGDEDEHNFGPSYGPGTTDILVSNSLLQGFSYRGPYIRRGTGHIFMNNLLFNYVTNNAMIEIVSGSLTLSAVGNVVLGGNQSSTNAGEDFPFFYELQAGSEIHLEDNKTNDGTQSSAFDWSYTNDMWDGGDPETYKVLSTPFTWPSGLTAISSASVQAAVIADVGAMPAVTNTIDDRLRSQVGSGTGPIVDTINYTDSDCVDEDEGPGSMVLKCCSALETGPCTQNTEAGWVALATETTTHSDMADPYSDTDGDGYTDFEEWIFSFSHAVEDLKVYEVSPADGATNQDINITLAWLNPADTTGVDLWFEKDDASPDVKVIDNDLQTSYDHGTLDPSSTYYFQLKIYHANGDVTGEIYSFTTEDSEPADPGVQGIIGITGGGGGSMQGN